MDERTQKYWKQIIIVFIFGICVIVERESLVCNYFHLVWFWFYGIGGYLMANPFYT